MDAQEAINNADMFLREPANARISRAVKDDKRPAVKEELQVLRLSDEVEEMIMDTLKDIHGKDFKLADASSYTDMGAPCNKKYWLETGTLIVKGGFDYSNVKSEDESEEDRLKMFAVMRLESYGFHYNHCLEALEHCEGSVEDALKILYDKYFEIDPPSKENEHGFSEKELLAQRVEEKNALESIYDDKFTEKFLNHVWLFECKLDYIVRLYGTKRDVYKKPAPPKEKKNLCLNMLKAGSCKYGPKCRFSHDMPTEPAKDPNEHLLNHKFQVEIRFPKSSLYPYEPPLIFLRSDAALPEMMHLHICKRLWQEAKTMCEDGIPSVYSIVEFLQNEENIKKYLKDCPIDFLSPKKKLFEKQKNGLENGLIRASHYKKGITSRDNKIKLTTEQIRDDDVKIAKSYMLKFSDFRYKRMIEIRRNLPAWTLKKEIIDIVKNSQVTVISGETGCGKSTQVPQYILDNWLGSYNRKEERLNDHVEIVCTQPRRISAIGVAERVADERAERIGNSVGYQIRLESKVSSLTRLTFCTTGILLRRLEGDSMLSNVSHIIVDEVHERSEESDFLLLILRDLLPLRPDLKVILMSATLNSSLFSSYFGNIPIVNIPGRTFPVEQIFLEDLLDRIEYVQESNTQYTRSINLTEEQLEFEMASSDIMMGNVKVKDCLRDQDLSLAQMMARYSGCSRIACKNLYMMDTERVNLDLIQDLLVWIVRGDHAYGYDGAILVFLPGFAEIQALFDLLTDHKDFNPRNSKFVLIPLHSSLTSDEQSLVFKTYSNKRKIVLSTNIAETSVTIDDCVFVIDAGRMKEKRFDSNRNMESLDMVWVTRANALQRKGRAGRVRSGVCFHLYTSFRYHHHILSQPVPEIHRIPLESLLMNIRVLPNFTGKTLHEVLANTIEPPSLANIDSSIQRLQYVGAFDGSQQLTALGHHLAALPVDVRIGKLMLFGAIFNCVDAALTMAACLSHKSPFVCPFGCKDAANKKRLQFCVSRSDQLTTLQAYRKWREAQCNSFAAGRNFAKENYLSLKTLMTIADVKHQFLELLVSIGFIPIDLKQRRRKTGTDDVLTLTGKEFNVNGDNHKLLSAMICAALYPNIVKVLTPQKSFQISMGGAVPKQLDSKDFRFKTKQDVVFMHPSSVNFIASNFASPYLVYQEKVKTSKIFIRDCCMVPLLSLVLFSGFNLDIKVHSEKTYIMFEDGWIMFQVEEHKIAEMLKMIRKDLQDLLEEKIQDPLLNLSHHAKGEKIIKTILYMISNDF